MTRLFPSVLLVCAILSHSLHPVEGAVSPSGPLNQGQIEGTVVHVDKLGVYIPNYIFYWDTSIGKQNMEALTKAAEKLRNSRAIITYSSNGDLSTDKRPVLVDIIAADELTKRVTLGDSSGYRPGQYGQDETIADVQEPQDEDGEEQDDADAEEDYVVYSAIPRRMNDDYPPWAQESVVKPIGRDEVLRLVNRCLKANNSKDMDNALACYGNRVEYYDSGLVDRDFIRKDKIIYFSNWERIDFALDSDVTLIVTDQQDIRIAKFETAFAVANKNKAIRGRVENIWKIKRINDELKIVGERQRILVRQ